MREVIIACDFSSKQQTLAFLDQFTEKKPFVKIGMELFYAEGPSIVTEIKNRGHKIFLDLKLHDIPNTVYKAMLNIGKLKVDMTNVHAAGTIAMMAKAKQALLETNPATLLIAVTQLTSTEETIMHSELLISETLNNTVIKYAQNAEKAGLDGVVCSPLEANLIKQNCQPNFISVTPGIRFASNTKDDQKRVTTPKQAKEIGASYIVVGRSITQAADPVAAYNRCVLEFEGE